MVSKITNEAIYVEMSLALFSKIRRTLTYSKIKNASRGAN